LVFGFWVIVMTSSGIGTSLGVWRHRRRALAPRQGAPRNRLSLRGAERRSNLDGPSAIRREIASLRSQ
jgi:hypothetical protein